MSRGLGDVYKRQFVYIPSEEWKKNLKQALIAYAADNSKWDGVKNAFVDGWKTEKAASE